MQDLRFAVRLLLKDRGFAVAAVLTLALGIGANVTIFSAVDAVLLKPLPFAHADRLVGIWKQNPTRGWTHNPISTVELVAWLDQGQAFEDAAAFTGRSCVVSGLAETEEDPCEIVSSRLFPLLGVIPIRGRTFTADEDAAGASPAVVLSYGLWQRRFGGADAAIGQTMVVNGVSHTVVGVMPASFVHTYASPFAAIPQMWVSGIGIRPVTTFNDYMAIGRLKPGIDPHQAERALDVVSAGIDTAYPVLNGWRVQLRTLRDMNAGDTRLALLVLFGAVTFVLLIACANVANLLLARGIGRAHEFALRAALGAGRWRVIRQLIIENLLIATLGGALGLALAWWGTGALVSLAPDYLLHAAPGLDRTPIDLRVFAFALIAALATTLLFGLAPTIQGATPDVAGTLRETGRGSSSARRRHLRGGLVVAQIALAMALLVGAGLMLRTLASLHGVHLGIDPAQVLTLRVPLVGDRYKEPAAVASFWNEVVRRVRTLPGVEAVSPSRGVSIGDWAGQFVTLADRPNPPAGQQPDASYNVAGPNYFQTLRIPLKAGRRFDARDTSTSELVAIVNEDFVRRNWPGQNPIGKRVHMGTSANTFPWMSIVGVVGDVLTQGIDAGVHAEIYVSDQQYPWLMQPRHLIVRTVAGIAPDTMTQAIIREVHRVDPQQPVADVRTLEQLAGEPLTQQRMVAALLGAFAGLALTLSALGIYGVVSYSVAQRRREIGVRLALGAEPARVLRLVMSDGARLAMIGVIAGTIASLMLTRSLTGLLYGIQPTDARTFAAGGVVLAAAALLACYVPARQAMRIEPADVLRRE